MYSSINELIKKLESERVRLQENLNQLYDLKDAYEIHYQHADTH